MINTKKTKRIKRLSRKKLVILAVLLLAVIAVSIFFLNKRNNSATDTGIDPPGTEKIDLSPPTEDDKKAVEDHKDALVKQQEQARNAPTTGRSVSVTIVDASQYNQEIEVRAFASGVYEDGATCTIKFTKGDQSLTKQVSAEKDSNYMRCTNLVVPRSELPSSGEWTVIVSYNSSTATGSKQQRINVI